LALPIFEFDEGDGAVAGPLEDPSQEPESEWEPDSATLRAPFPYFGGKSGVASLVWRAFGPRLKQYIEPFMGSLAVLLAAPYKPNLEVVNDRSFYLANFWRAVKHQPDEVARWADYPVSHVDVAARHQWLTEPTRLSTVAVKLLDPEWEGDARYAGWWIHGQCSWIGAGWCEKEISASTDRKKPYMDLGKGIQCHIPTTLSDEGSGAEPWEAIGVPDRGEYIQRRLRALSRRLQDVRIVHGDWTRCLNAHYGGGGDRVGVLLDPPYLSYERLYAHSKPVALEVAEWAASNAGMRVAVCGHVGDYDAILRASAGWRTVRWSRGKFTYSGSKTTDAEAVYFSPACDSASVE